MAKGDKSPECWRYPPNVLVQKENSRQWSYPLINDTLFCGEFRPKDNLVAVEWVTWLKGMGQDAIQPNMQDMRS